MEIKALIENYAIALRALEELKRQLQDAETNLEALAKQIIEAEDLEKEVLYSVEIGGENYLLRVVHSDNWAEEDPVRSVKLRKLRQI